jgi:hypothetical protein
MDEKYHLYAIQAILEELEKPKKQRMLSDEELEKMLQIELEALKEHGKAKPQAHLLRDKVWTTLTLKYTF